MIASGRRRWRGDTGSLAIELAMLAPALLLIFGLIFAYGRVGQVNGVLESGTRDAARSVTMSRSLGEAQARADLAVAQALGAAPTSCRSSVRVTIEGAFQPGSPVTVSARCTYSLADIGLPGAPGSITANSSFTSMLDPYRGIG